MIKKILNQILNIIIGWLAGMLTGILLSFLWVKIIPVIDRTGQGPYMTSVLSYILLLLSPFPAIGGFIGGRIQKEGSIREQLIFAAFFGFFFSIPVVVFLLWLTGF